MDEYGAAAAYVYTTLSADVTLQGYQSTRVYEGMARGAFPCTVYQWQGGADDVNMLGGTRVLTHLLMLIKAIQDGDSISTISTISARIDALLHNASGTSNGYYQEWVRRSPFRLSERVDGVSYQHLGAVYEVLVHAV
jgi:hypothetical protein